MKRNLFVIAVVLAALTMAAGAYAGDFHTGAGLKCQDCHTMHHSQAHSYNSDGSGSFTPLSGTPHEYLLRDDINDLCLSCHNGQVWAPDVFESHSNGYVRQAGALNVLGGNGSYPPITGHTLNAIDAAPGGTWSNPDGLSCVDCHAAHGGGLAGNSYRNLGGFGTAPGPFSAISYTNTTDDGANPLTAWVHEDTKAGTNANHYGVGAIAFNELDAGKSAYGDFCKGCHTDFHGDVGGIEIEGSGTPPQHFIRHPANGVDIGILGGGHSSIGVFAAHTTNQVQVMSPTGKKAGTYLATDVGLTPSCMSCHKGHGNQNAFGLIYMTGTGGGAITEEGDGGTEVRDLCKQCHVQG